MSTQVTVIGQICQSLDKMQSSLNETLSGTGVSVNRFIATAKTAVQTHSDKKGLEGADRNSLYLAIKKAASDGLMPDGRDAALVVYGGKVQYQPMVQGLVKLARNSGEIESINSEVVYENDTFVLGYDMNGVTFEHKPNWMEDRGRPVLVWATVKLKSGEVIARAYPKSRIDQIATRSRMAANYDPEKGKDWEEFWRKAAIRNILKYAPKSTQLDKALESDNVEFEDSSPEDVIPDVTKSKPVKETAASKAIKESVVQDDVIDITEDDSIIDVEFDEDDLPI